MFARGAIVSSRVRFAFGAFEMLHFSDGVGDGVGHVFVVEVDAGGGEGGEVGF